MKSIIKHICGTLKAVSVWLLTWSSINTLLLVTSGSQPDSQDSRHIHMRTHTHTHTVKKNFKDSTATSLYRNAKTMVQVVQEQRWFMWTQARAGEGQSKEQGTCRHDKRKVVFF